MKKFLLGAFTVLAIALIIVNTGVLSYWNYNNFFNKRAVVTEPAAKIETYETFSGVKYRVKAQGDSFFFFEEGEWKQKFLKGVNIGASKPGIFPGELTVSYEEYYRWFEYIGKMNANCIRVYTIMRPQFYNALLDYNKSVETPLYLVQGVWMNESDIYSLADVYAENEKIKTNFLKDAKNTVDALHGNISLPVRRGFASGEYTADVTDYLAAIIVGIEWDPKFVKNTNDNNPDRTTYDGKYLYTLNASTFEAFLCSVGDEVIEYQTDKYSYQVPIAFANWVTTDPLTHPSEPHLDEDMISVNMENIRYRDAYLAKMFLAYHVYPYYPEVLNYDLGYINYVDPYGRKNPYRAYLRDLRAIHTMPILIAEYGIPTSRGIGHESVMGYNQGAIDETAQGDMLVEMMNSMYEENYAGGLVFTWQDEWFKRTWNNENFDVKDQRPFWSNAQTNEQSFGILAFDPGTEKNAVYIDGDITDWQEAVPLLVGQFGSLYIKSDERYVYFMIDTEDFDFNTNTLFIPIDIIENQGNFASLSSNVTFDKAADFLISVAGPENSRITVDSYYDVFYYLYGEQYKMLPLISDVRTKNSGRFNAMQICFGYEMTLPVIGPVVTPEPTKQVIPFKSKETGKLTYGISNPSSTEYKSLGDIYNKDNVIELRIPWQLLNVMDPTKKLVMDDLYTMQSIVPISTLGFSAGVGIVDPLVPSTITMSASYTWDNWVLPTYHERLKPSYYVLQEGFLKFR